MELQSNNQSFYVTPVDCECPSTCDDDDDFSVATFHTQLETSRHIHNRDARDPTDTYLISDQAVVSVYNHNPSRLQGNSGHDTDEEFNSMDSTLQSSDLTLNSEELTPPRKKTPISGYQLRSAWRQLIKHRGIKITQLLLVAFIMYYTYGPPGIQNPTTKLIVDEDDPSKTAAGLMVINGTERAIVGASQFQVAALGVARASAWFMYIPLILVFVTKFRATMGVIARTPLSMYIDGDVHELHRYCGWTILICSLVHGGFHIARWADQGNLSLLVHHFSGITGLIMIGSILLICIPMMCLRKCIKFELRKKLHYFFLVFALALCFHTPKSAIPNGGFTAYIFGCILAWYFLDAVYCLFFMTEKIETTRFKVLPNGVQMTMEVSDAFRKNCGKGGFCYVCLPWVDRDQWHAFSLFENPGNPRERQIYMQKAGDWTDAVYERAQRHTVRPVWVQGPFPSPYLSAEEYDNQILVASGIGITPALSVIRAHKDSRRINLIWTVRDRHLLEFFLRHLYLDHDGWNLIFYTGREALPADVEIFSNTNVCIIMGRPKLRQLVPNIIYGIESGMGLPERYVPEVKQRAADMLAGLNESVHSRAVEEIALQASEQGFTIADRETFQNELQKSSKGPRKQKSAAILRHLHGNFRPWEFHAKANSYVKKFSREDPAITSWGLLYCGNAKPLEAEVKRMSDKYRISLHIESFGW